MIETSGKKLGSKQGLYVALSDFRRQHRRSIGGQRAGARPARVSMARAATEAGPRPIKLIRC